MSLLRSYLLGKSIIGSYKTWTPLLIGVRNAYLRDPYYPNWYLDPVASVAELEVLEREGKLESMKVMPVKPAPPNLHDSVLTDPVLKHFTNIVMMWSDRQLAQKLMRGTFANIKRIQLEKYHAASDEEKASIELNPLNIFKQAIENCKPILSLTPIRKGGITYQVPVPITPKRAEWMSMKWLVMAARDKEGEISFVDQMSKELLDAYNQEGRVIKRKHDLHKVCENNKAYAHYRWS